MCDATDDGAVRRLREAKGRAEKPFAVLCADVAEAGTLCHVDDAAAAVLESPECPIALLPLKPAAPIAPNVAPRLSHLGVSCPRRRSITCSAAGSAARSSRRAATCSRSPSPPTTTTRARGYAPLPVRVRGEWPSILAVGAHLKNTVALAVRDQVFVSQHIGDLETEGSQRAFERVIEDFLRMYRARPEAIAHALHPDYLSTRWARRAAP